MSRVAAPLVVAVMARVPAIFTLSLATLGGAWLADGRTTAGLALIAAAGGAAAVGLQIAVARRWEARSRLAFQRRDG